jgi:hypothetical protein
MFSLRDGRSIRTVSALLFQLVQTSAHDVRVAARKIAKARGGRQALRRQDSMASERSAEPAMDELDAEVSANDNCMALLTTIAGNAAVYHGTRVSDERCKDDSCVSNAKVSKMLLPLVLIKLVLLDLGKESPPRIPTRPSTEPYLTTLFPIFLSSSTGPNGQLQVYYLA